MGLTPTNNNSNHAVCQPADQPDQQNHSRSHKGNRQPQPTLQVVNTDQPALLSTKARKSLGVLAMNADFIRKCTSTDHKSEYLTISLPTPLPNTSTHAWPKPGSFTKSVRENWIASFMKCYSFKHEGQV